MKILCLSGVLLFITACSSTKPESKPEIIYDFSNVKTTSMGAQNYNNSPSTIMTDTITVIETPENKRLSQ